jgi:hypothetical protein
LHPTEYFTGGDTAADIETGGNITYISRKWNGKLKGAVMHIKAIWYWYNMIPDGRLLYLRGGK